MNVNAGDFLEYVQATSDYTRASMEKIQSLEKEMAVLRQDNLTLTGQVSQLAELLSRTVDRLKYLERTADIVNATIAVSVDNQKKILDRVEKLEQEQPDGK